MRNKHLVHLVLEHDALLLHGLKGKIVDWDVVFFETLNLRGQYVVLIVHLAEKTVGSPERLDRVDEIRELPVKLVMLDLHDHALPRRMDDPSRAVQFD